MLSLIATYTGISYFFEEVGIVYNCMATLIIVKKVRTLFSHRRNKSYLLPTRDRSLHIIEDLVSFRPHEPDAPSGEDRLWLWNGCSCHVILNRQALLGDPRSQVSRNIN